MKAGDGEDNEAKRRQGERRDSLGTDQKQSGDWGGKSKMVWALGRKRCLHLDQEPSRD